MPSTTDYTASELLAVMSSRLLKNGQIVFAGVGIPLLAATLAQGLHCPGLTILFEGGVIGPVIEPGKLPPSTNEQRCTIRANMVLASTDVLLLLQRGYVDVGFMGGAQIDQYGNLNSSFIGDPAKPKTRLPGTGGGNDIASLAQMIVAMGGMYRVVTDLGIFGFDDETRRMNIVALHPGVTLGQVQDNTGFELASAPDIGVTERPTELELEFLRKLDPDRLYTA
ncbi:MAG: 3-oxoadipate--succinyl-CoA transferase subunit B [Betaproteobacteria bacterium]|nr:3-oxoadipate--succinyl-CoA transferase subunit B [Betaproteobacteria bacterium]